MSQEREARIFRNGRNQAVRIPREFEFSGERGIIRKVGRRLFPSDIAARYGQIRLALEKKARP